MALPPCCCCCDFFSSAINVSNPFLNVPNIASGASQRDLHCQKRNSKAECAYRGAENRNGMRTADDTDREHAPLASSTAESSAALFLAEDDPRLRQVVGG